MSKIFLYLFFICCTVGIYSCQKEMSAEVGSTLKATGSLWDSIGNCLPDSVHGTFYNGITAGGDTAYVDIQVNVTATGSYKIESDIQDGFLFTDSGFFTNTGLNTIRLKPLGIPIIPTTATFNISFDSSFCSFSVVINDSTGTGLGGVKDTTGTGNGGDSTVNIADDSWQFIANGHTYSGTYILSILGPSVSGSQLVLTGFPISGSTDTTFSLTVQFPSTTIDTGYYKTSFAGTNFALAKLTGDIIFAANAFDDPVLTIHLISYDSTTKIVTGTFYGDSYDFDGNVVPITQGEFKATITN